MVAVRLIPCLDVRDGRVVKGVRFRNHREMGDIVELAERYRDEGADELVFYDMRHCTAILLRNVALVDHILVHKMVRI